MSDINGIPRELFLELLSKYYSTKDLRSLGLDERQLAKFLRAVNSHIGIPDGSPGVGVIVDKRSGAQILYMSGDGAKALATGRGICQEQIWAHRDTLPNGTYLVEYGYRSRMGEVYIDTVGSKCVELTKKGKDGEYPNTEAIGNAAMMAETKARRRGIKDLCQTGMIDESELDSVPDFQIVNKAK